DENSLNGAENALIREYGPIEIQSPVFDFDMTDYYTAEMGRALKKKFYCFQRPVEPDTLSDIKLFANGTELTLPPGDMEKPSRTVNIDPGYVTLAKLVLASTKDYSHRIYIGKGVFAEVTLRFIKGTFSTLETTFPDYKTPLAIEFFNSARDFVKRNIKEWNQKKE
ncbi:MAG: DUF4416 family protein, partial [Candidatus Latescibacteria bacterium]|nr:DUF4416 family protein [Candidatus Latescibacterota bacterium]